MSATSVEAVAATRPREEDDAVAAVEDAAADDAMRGNTAKRLKTPGAGWTSTGDDAVSGGDAVSLTVVEDAAATEARVDRIASAVATILDALGEDPTREGLVKTPHRMAKLLVECTDGYRKQLSTVLNGAVFHETYSEMVLVKDINIFSLCEHHVVPFFGKVHIAYIPRGKVLGLSKLARIAEMFARRLQVQERLTCQIASAVSEAISPLGVGVVIEATHMCMSMRGARQPGSSTVTSSVLGCFQSDPRTRAEFFANISRRS